MKKIGLASLSFFLLLSVVVHAQKVTFKLINGSSLQPIQGASLTSYLNPKTKIVSDTYGHVTITLTENDTISISKDYFHPLYLFVRMKNFDTTHVIAINMVPSKEIHVNVVENFSSLTDFEYHFVHNQFGQESHFKVVGFEHPTASQLRTEMMHSNKNPDGFHITPVLHYQQVGKNQYSIK